MEVFHRHLAKSLSGPQGATPTNMASQVFPSSMGRNFHQVPF